MNTTEYQLQMKGFCDGGSILTGVEMRTSAPLRIKRNDNFIPKKMKKSILPIISKIIDVKEDGSLTFQFEREGDVNDWAS